MISALPACDSSGSREPIVFPAHALLILEERLREQEAESVEMPKDIERDEPAVRILIAAAAQIVRCRLGPCDCGNLSSDSRLRL